MTCCVCGTGVRGFEQMVDNRMNHPTTHATTPAKEAASSNVHKSGILAFTRIDVVAVVEYGRARVQLAPPGVVAAGADAGAVAGAGAAGVGSTGVLGVAAGADAGVGAGVGAGAGAGAGVGAGTGAAVGATTGTGGAGGVGTTGVVIFIGSPCGVGAGSGSGATCSFSAALTVARSRRTGSTFRKCSTSLK